jgi:Cdc6-like AAA superfamily ATPase
MGCRGMAIAGIDQDTISKIIRDNLTPSSEITTPERLFGRERALKDVTRALNSNGRSVFIHGDRGVGKSSVALTAATLITDSSMTPIRVMCGKEDTFAKVIRSIGNACLTVAQRIESPAKAFQVGLSILGSGGSFNPGERSRVEIPLPDSLNDALDIIRFALEKRQGQFVVVIDEMERIASEGEREKFAEFIKNIPALEPRVKFIFCGIAATLTELVGEHPSAGRILEPVKLERLRHNELWQIIEVVAKNLNIEIESEALIQISRISDGFPTYVHLIGDSMFWSVFDDSEIVSAVKVRHFREGITGALQRSDATLRAQYEKATMKTKNTQDYEEALWALADTSSDWRQLTEIYDSSYKKIMLQRSGRTMLAKETLNTRFHSLRKDGHGRVVVNKGAGWFAFRENIIRGYVRLKAQEQGIQLGRDNAMRNV